MAQDAHLAQARIETQPAIGNAGNSEHPGLFEWLHDNVVVPAYDQGIVSTANAAVNVVNGLTFHHVLDKMQPVAVKDSSGPVSEFTQMVSGGVAGYIPVAVLSGFLHMGLKPSTAGLIEPLAKIGASQTTSLVLAAGALDAARDVRPGETRLSNVVSGMVGFGLLGAGSAYTSNWSAFSRFAVANPLIGAASAEAQLATSSLMTGQSISEKQFVATATSGAIFNTMMPAINKGFEKLGSLGGRSSDVNASTTSSEPNARTPEAPTTGKAEQQAVVRANPQVSLPDIASTEPGRIGSESVAVNNSGAGATTESTNALSLSRADVHAAPEETTGDGSKLLPPVNRTSYIGPADLENVGESTAGDTTAGVKRPIPGPGSAVVHENATKAAAPGSEDLVSGDEPKAATTVPSEAKVPVGNPLVIGAGGVKVYEAIGALMAMHDLNIPVSTVTGVSAGGDAAAALANGLSAKELLDMTLDSRSRMYSPETFVDALKIPTWNSLFNGDSWISLENLWQKEVAALGWKPNDRLRLVAAYKDPTDGSYKPYVFRGSDYDLGKGLAATGALPGVFAPVQIGDKSLVDGGLYHFNPVLPGEAKPSIVLRMNRVTEMPTRLQFPWVFFPTGESQLPPLAERQLYLKEMYPSEPINNSVDTTRNVLVDLQTDVPGVNFWISKEKALAMVKDGYNQALPQLKAALKAGKIFASPADTKPRSKPSG